MALRAYWIVLLLLCCLACQLNLASAKEPSRCQEVPHDNHSNSPLSEDLVQQLTRRLPNNKLAQWLLDRLFTHPQAPKKKSTTATYFPYEGKNMGCIRLNKHGAACTNTASWGQLAKIICPTTKDSVILRQLGCSPGDSLFSQQLLASQDRLNELTYIAEAKITVQEQEGNGDTVDVHITTRDRWPITINLGFDSEKPAFCITHNNLFGWGHTWQHRFLYNQGLEYNSTYIQQSGVTSELQYLATQKKSIKKISIFRDFTDQVDHAGGISASRIRQVERRIIDGSPAPQETSYSFYHQCLWLGTTFKHYGIDGHHEGHFFVTGKVVHQHFDQRPVVTKSTNRYFHHHVLGIGSLGFVNKQVGEDRLVDGAGNAENISYGSKVNLIGGYQFGEFINRPYLYLNIAHSRHLRQLGHFYGAMHVSGFWGERTVEQGILQLQLHYFTPLLGMGSQLIRQFIRLDYVAGYNMFTGELISTNIKKVAKKFKDPFLGGTRRLCIGLETVLFTPTRLAGCQVATLGFVDMARLEDARGKVQQNSFCKALGIGWRCTHPRFSLGTLQVKLGYAPITQNMLFAINLGTADSLDDLDIGEPEIMLFQEY
ncbi:MAG: hypothetical protein MUC61_01085 [Amoebophilaceae bacterium]|jgi:hypothetical protein|nr:hypothetical protein [Amoebophilaceae bacterium]